MIRIRPALVVNGNDPGYQIVEWWEGGWQCGDKYDPEHVYFTLWMFSVELLAGVYGVCAS